MDAHAGTDHHPAASSALPIDASLFEVSPDDPMFDREARPIAKCYQLVFGTDRAWSEGKICHACSRPGAPKKWNFLDAPPDGRCSDCGGEVADFWPISQILADMRQELARPDAVCAVLRQGEAVIGGCWGFSATPEGLDEHLNHGLAAHVCAPDVAATLRAMYPGVERFAYQDEIFLRPEFQRQGLGKRLFAARHAGFAARDLAVYVMRTKRNPPSTSYRWFRDGWGYRTVTDYPDADQRVILAHTFEAVSRRL